LEAGWQGSKDFKALVGGEALPKDLADQLIAQGVELWNMYGPTETTVWSTCWKVERPEQGVSIGRPIANTQVLVLDQYRQLCPIGVPGEIYIGGDGVTLGYLNRPELTAHSFVDDPYSAIPGTKLYRTGDRGRRRHDGLLEHMGRLDFQIKVRGHRVEPGEIESNLAAHPLVARAVVIVREDQREDVRLVAYIVPKEIMPTASELHEHLRASLPAYMLPQHYVEVETIPLLLNGKIDRHSLPAPTNSAATYIPVFAAPRTNAERVIAEIWQRLLGIERVSVTDNFLDLGGHSLLAMKAVVEIEKRLGARLNVSRLAFESLGMIAANESNVGLSHKQSSIPKRGLFSRLVSAFTTARDENGPG
jgi:acyl carrier protein